MIVHLAWLLTSAAPAAPALETSAAGSRGPAQVARHVEQWLASSARGFCATTGISTFDSSCAGTPALSHPNSSIPDPNPNPNNLSPLTLALPDTLLIASLPLPTGRGPHPDPYLYPYPYPYLYLYPYPYPYQYPYPYP